MADLVDKLRDYATGLNHYSPPSSTVVRHLLRDAADEIEELRGLIDRVQSLHNPNGGHDDCERVVIQQRTTSVGIPKPWCVWCRIATFSLRRRTADMNAESPCVEHSGLKNGSRADHREDDRG